MPRPKITSPGQYTPDPTVGITRPEDLPKPLIKRMSRNYKSRPCPKCGQGAARVRTYTRTLHQLGDLAAGRGLDLHLTCSQHKCKVCEFHFQADCSDLALPDCHYTLLAQAVAVRVVVEDGLSYRAAEWHLWRDHRLFVPWATIQNWVEGAGKKGAPADADGVPE
jgi:transposase